MCELRLIPEYNLVVFRFGAIDPTANIAKLKHTPNIPNIHYSMPMPTVSHINGVVWGLGTSMDISLGLTRVR